MDTPNPTQPTPVAQPQPAATPAPTATPAATVDPKTAAELKQAQEELASLKEQNEKLFSVAKFVAEDPELTTAFQNKWNVKNNPTPATPTTPNPVDDKIKTVEDKVNTLEAKQRVEALADFENKIGIVNLPAEKAKEVRGKIGAKIKEYGYTMETLPIDKFGLLNDAFMVTNPDLVTNEASMRSAAQARNNGYGSFGPIPSTHINSSEKSFTPGEMDFLNKFGIDPEKAKKYTEY